VEEREREKPHCGETGNCARQTGEALDDSPEV